MARVIGAPAVSMLRWALFVQGLLSASLYVAVTGQHLKNDIHSLLHDTDVNDDANRPEMEDDLEVELFYRPEGEHFQESSNSLSGYSDERASQKSTESVRRLWGVADTEAHVGKIFSYPIPHDAFQGTVEDYQVRNLPIWLNWNARTGYLEGLARSADRGHHYITVKALGSDGSVAKDVFSIEVLEIPGPALGKDAGCKPKEDVTVVSVLLDVHLPSMPAKARVTAARTAAKMLGLKENRVFIVPAPAESDPMADDSAIVAGPGSAKIMDHVPPSKGQSYVQATVGCDGEIGRQHQKIVDGVEVIAKDGSLQEALGIPVVGWHVTQVNPISRRVRREADYSGFYYDYDDFDYPYIYGEEIEPATRVIPSLATPIFTETSATYFPGHGIQPQYVSPVLRPVPISTPVYIPVKPTRVVVEASPTVVQETTHPAEAHPYPNLESSLVVEPTAAVVTTTPLTTTSTVTSDPVVPTRPVEHTTVPPVLTTGVRNFPPRINSRIKKQPWIAGHVYRMRIPEDTFTDLEDGNTRKLRLYLKGENGRTLGPNSWIQFDPLKQEIYALPLEGDIGRYSFLLEALDSDGKSIMDTVKINVQQPREARNYHHKYTATFKLEKKYEYEFTYSLDWEVKAVQKITQLFGDTVDSINVRSISRDPVRLTWTNVTVVDPSATSCPVDALEAIESVLMAGSGQEPSQEMKEAFQPEFHLKKVHAHYTVPCDGLNHHPSIPGGGASGEDTLPDTGDRHPDSYKNEPPIFRNQIDQLNVTMGRLYRYQVPVDTCYDLEDGDSRRLRLRLLTSNLAQPPDTSWLQFDKANQEFFGLALRNDVGKEEYILECVDSSGNKVNDVLFVEVRAPAVTAQPSHEFSITVDNDYGDFMADLYVKTRLIERIGQAFGDGDARNIVIDSVQKGSVVLTWHNASLPVDTCPNDELLQLRRIMTDDNGDLRKDFVDSFSPEYVVTRGFLRPAGECLAGDTPIHVEPPDLGPPDDEQIVTEEEDYMLTFIVPAVIIAVMLLLAAVIACCLYRRRRYGKMTMADDRTFVSKGIPIIFAEELDDHRPDPAKSPVIMKEEKPPLPPPEYQRNSPPVGMSSTPPVTERRRPLSSDPGSSDDAPYQPPPPFTATNGASRNQRPNMPPAYKKPPTYVPP